MTEQKHDDACGASRSDAVLDADRDIVDRLRDSQPSGTNAGFLLNDAADEIERLRNEVKLWRRMGSALHEAGLREINAA
jgi:hypothetical protein